jgi:hypothetical protein
MRIEALRFAPTGRSIRAFSPSLARHERAFGSPEARRRRVEWEISSPSARSHRSLAQGILPVSGSP